MLVFWAKAEAFGEAVVYLQKENRMRAVVNRWTAQTEGQ